MLTTEGLVVSLEQKKDATETAATCRIRSGYHSMGTTPDMNAIPGDVECKV